MGMDLSCQMCTQTHSIVTIKSNRVGGLRPTTLWALPNTNQVKEFLISLTECLVDNLLRLQLKNKSVCIYSVVMSTITV